MTEETFNAGDYIVLLSTAGGDNSWKEAMPEGYCYKLSQESYIDSRGFVIDTNINGITDGWSAHDPNFKSLLNFRHATPKEIQGYIDNNRPYEVDPIDFLPPVPEDLSYLEVLFKERSII